ncbi:MAG: benzoylsuccinyl-CoA thiolase [Acidimicrobiaceae bacterium]|nr:benzoylsuccinyl-CoA thiolase [Acidimicrobiaceae bacterium]
MRQPSTRQRVPAVEGFFTMDDEPSLIGGRLDTGGYCFPRHLGGSDPRQPSGDVEEILLSRRGRIWSFTNSAYPPPPPFIVAEPYVPVVVAAVELEAEKMVVLGQVVPGFTVDDIEVGMEVELILGLLYADEDTEYLTWQWRPVDAEPSAGGVA